jgi:hypothetical protein
VNGVAELGLQHGTKTTVFPAGMRDYLAMNEIDAIAIAK